jgi:ATP synthase protein I
MAEDDDGRLHSNLDRLNSSLSKARETQHAETGPRADIPDATRGDSGISLGMRAGSEFVSAVVLGAGIGWALDRLLKTNPAFLIVFFLLGVAAGIWNVIRLTSPKGGGPKRDSSLSHANAADKPAAETDASRARGGAGRANEASGGADDDED